MQALGRESTKAFHYPFETVAVEQTELKQPQSEKADLTELLEMLPHDMNGYQVLTLLRKMGTVVPSLVSKIFRDVDPDLLSQSEWQLLLRLSNETANRLPERYKTDENCVIACNRDPSKIVLFPADVRARVVHTLIDSVPFMYEYLPNEDKTVDLYTRFVQEYASIALKHTPHHVIESAPELLNELPTSTLSYYCDKLPNTYKTRQFFISLANPGCYNSNIFKNLPEHLKNDRDFYRNFCSHHGLALRDVPPAMIDESLHRIAVANSPEAIAYVAPSVPYYQELYQDAIQKSVTAWVHVSPKADFVDEKFYLDAFKKMTSTDFASLSTDFLATIPKPFLTEAFFQELLPKLERIYINYIPYLPDSMKHDSKICFDAVTSSIWHLKHLPECMKTEELCKHALKTAAHLSPNIFPTHFLESDTFFEYAANRLKEEPFLLKALPNNRLTVELCRSVISDRNVVYMPDAIEAYKKLAESQPCEPLLTQDTVSCLYQGSLMRALTSPDLDDASRQLLIKHLSRSADRPDSESFDAKTLISTTNPVSNFSVFNPLMQRLIHVGYSTPNFMPPLFPEGMKLKLYTKKEASRPFKPMSTDEPLLNSTNPRPIGGRTLQVSENGKTFYYKFQRRGESLANLVGEGLTHTYMQQVKPALGKLLKSDMPHNTDFFTLPTEKLSHLPEFRDQIEVTTDKTGDSQVHIYRYQAAAGYGIYAHQLDRNACNPVEKPEQGLLRACHDIGVFTSLGLTPTSTLPAFHDTDSGRRWTPLHSVLGYSIVCAMPGTFGAWNTTATEHPDFGYSGFRDVYDVELYGEIDSYMRIKDTCSDCHPHDVAQRLMLANASIENLLAAVLIRSRLQQQLPEYHYKNPEALLQTQRFVEAALNEFIQGYCQCCTSVQTERLQSFLELNDQDYSNWLERVALEIVYWTAAQPDRESPDQPAFTRTRFDHSDCYALHIRQKSQLTTELYPQDSSAGLDQPLSQKYPKNFHNVDGKQNLGANNRLFPLTSLTNGLIRLACKLLENNPQMQQGPSTLAV